MIKTNALLLERGCNMAGYVSKSVLIFLSFGKEKITCEDKNNLPTYLHLLSKE